jgi:hypothetical protein
MADGARDNRRGFYRLRYPEAERPRVEADGLVAAVTELSEGGMRVVAGDFRVAVGCRVAGEVCFADGEAAWVDGTVLRHDAGEAILQLTVGVPLARMVAEQKRLLRLYPR